MLTYRSKRNLLIFIVWIWMFIGSLATIVFIAYIKCIPLVIEQLIDMLNREAYLASYAEVVVQLS